MDLQNPIKTPKAFSDNITRSPCMHYWVNDTLLHCKSHWPLTDMMIDFPEASNCGLTTGTLRSWVLLDALSFQINGMFSVLNWLPGARMMYSMCQCVGVDVCVISLLLIPAVNTSSCPSLTSSISPGLCALANTSDQVTKLKLIEVSAFSVTSSCSCLSCPCCVWTSWSSLCQGSFTIMETWTQDGTVLLSCSCSCHDGWGSY